MGRARRLSTIGQPMATRIRRRRRKPHHSRWHKIAIPLAALLAVALVAGGIAAAWALKIYNSAPPLASLKPVEKGRSSAIYAADGSLIGFIHSDNVRQPVPSSGLPQSLKDATVAIEDKNFYRHGALDPAGIVRAAVKDIEAGGKPVQGASTITQQLVRNLYIQNPKDTLERKIIEAHLANDLFEKHPREWILTEYLNTAPYGTVEGQTAVGAEAAAQTYFGKPAKKLGLIESALIAGLPQAPSEYNPFLDPKAALARRNEVLRAMAEQGYITSEESKAALAKGLELHPGHKYSRVRDPFLFDLVEHELINQYGLNTVRNGGLKAYTSIEPRVQEEAEAAVATCYDCYPGSKAAGLASVDPKTGAIVALASTEGGESEEQFNYAWQAHRQPGSSFKTFVLTTAIKQGIDPYTTYYDGTSPITLTIPGGGPPWTVHNAEPGLGVMPLSEATWASVNVVYAQLDLDVGSANVTETAEQMGIEAPLESVPAEAIGGLSIGVTPLEMADAYATLANGGVHHDPTAISKVVFPNGKVDEPGASSGERVLTPGEAYEVTKLLEGVITQGTGAGYTYMGCPSEAGKTGTSEEESDAWFVGYTPMYSTAVWVGHPQSREYTGYGGSTAGPIWRSYMESAQAGECPEFEVPSSLPSLSALKTGHTRLSSEASSKKKKKAKKGKRRRSRAPKKAQKKKAKKNPNRKRPRNPNTRPPPNTPAHRRRSAAASPRADLGRSRAAPGYSPTISIR